MKTIKFLSTLIILTLAFIAPAYAGPEPRATKEFSGYQAFVKIKSADEWPHRYHHSDEVDFPPNEREYLGCLGSMRYLVRDGKRISYGYHTIFSIPGGYVAERGSLKYVLGPDGKEIQNRR